jgi:Arc/MetJ-type ribon-helix-helix transcriptional regulator
MSRIDLSEPYELFLKSQVKSGLFRSITAAAEAAILKEMEAKEQLRIASIHAAIAKGEADIEAGRTIRYTSNLMNEIAQKGKEASLAGRPVKSDVK